MARICGPERSLRTRMRAGEDRNRRSGAGSWTIPRRIAATPRIARLRSRTGYSGTARGPAEKRPPRDTWMISRREHRHER